MARFGKSRKTGKSERKPDGQVRASQMIGAYGAGSMVDLVQHAVIICGLDDWNFAGEITSIEEARVKDRLEERYSVKLAPDDYFRLPPAPKGNDDPDPRLGVRALEFPAWFVCQSCRRLIHRRGLSEAVRSDGRRYHDCQDKGAPMVPVRFVGACTRGHLQDFPWRRFAHYGKDQETCANPELYLHEGKHGDFGEIYVRCACGAPRQYLASVYGEHIKLECDGERPWLPPRHGQECSQQLRLLVRTASNGYFALVHSALSVPDPDNIVRDALSKDVERIKKRLDKSEAKLRDFIEFDHEELVEAHGLDVVFNQAKALAEGQGASRDRTRTGEYKQLTTFAPEQPSWDEQFDEDEIFVPRRIETPESIRRYVRTVTLVHRLREVRVQFGFSRLEPPSADNQGEYDEDDIKIGVAPLGVNPTWLPAATVQGEGVFIELDPEAIEEWQKRPLVQRRLKALGLGWKRWHETRRKKAGDHKKDTPPFLGGKFYLLHSLSHLLISAIAMECGYSASAIRERIYCGPHGDDSFPMSGILLYTGTVGSEGTLGGLVEQGKRIDDHIRQALRTASLCSNDPLCAAHTPENDPSDRLLEGAACHGCLFVSEPSCERYNRYLDRALVVPVVGQPRELAFFDVPEGWL